MQEDLDLNQEIKALGDDVTDQQILAIVHRRFPSRGATGRHNGGGDRRGPPQSDRSRAQSDGPPRWPRAQSEGPPRSREDVTCPNCLEKGHFASECKKPRVERKDRVCFECGEKGHEARRCKNKQAHHVADEADTPCWAICGEEDGFRIVQRRGATRTPRKPTPQERRLECFMNANMYAALMQDSAGADKHEDG